MVSGSFYHFETLINAKKLKIKINLEKSIFLQTRFHLKIERNTEKTLKMRIVKINIFLPKTLLIKTIFLE